MLVGGVAGLPRAVAGQIEELLGVGQRWLEDRLDPKVLEGLRSGNPSSLEPWLRTVVERMQGEHVLDLAALGEAADAVLPLLEQHPETRGYASWLRARLDYFDVAGIFRRTLPRPKPAPNQPPPPPMTPTPEQERRAWKKQVEGQPAPKGAATWVPRLKPLFRGAGAPQELVWLAEVESSFDPEARSPAGAVGMYQLMPGTARDLGLKVTPKDERLVPEKNARAAATYLARLRRQFGDWSLALAAYNAGPGRVADTLKRRRATSYDAIAPHLPAETQMYVPKFEAVLRRREGMALGRLKASGKA
jgi:membrane-bound lytic murein transglycosylase D